MNQNCFASSLCRIILIAFSFFCSDGGGYFQRG
jgi:hypothetical protein